MPDFLIGIDLGQSSDPTAIAVLKRSLLIDANGLPVRDHRGESLYQFVCSHLVRHPLGTSYPNIVAAVGKLISDPKLQPDPWLAVDATGVGRAVVDLFLEAQMPARIVPITITAGDTVRRDRWNRSTSTGYWVPKNELVSVLQAGLQSRRFKIAPSLSLADTLSKELTDFRVTVTKSSTETFSAREGSHDDLVLATAMPLWLGVRRETLFRPISSGQSHPDHQALTLEADLERQALAKAAAQTQAESERNWYGIDNDHFWS